MKRTISKILGVALAIALLVCMVIGVIPVSANVSTPSVSLSASTISVASNYTVTFSVVTALTTGVASTDNIVITLPAGTNATAAAISKVQVGSGGGIGTNANPLVNVTAQTTFPANTDVTFLSNSGILNPSPYWDRFFEFSIKYGVNTPGWIHLAPFRLLALLPSWHR